MGNRNLAFAGAALLVVGLFTPIATFPIVGSINLFNSGSNLVALALLALAAISGALAAKGRFRDIIWPGLAAGGTLLYLFVRLQYALSQMRAAAAKDLEGNPFAGIAQAAIGAVQLQWGWLVLAAGAGLVIYTAFAARAEEEPSLFQLRDGTTRGVAAASLLLLLVAPAMDAWSSARAETEAPVPPEAGLGEVGDALAGPAAAGDLTGESDAEALSAEERAYIAQHLRLYDVQARYFESILDGRVPGVKFKIKNDGNRTLDRVEVRVVFHDATGNAIAEEEYLPVLVTEYSFGGDNKPLRPNYIWQQEADTFYAAKKVPSEWATGKVTATITGIEFGANE